MGAFSPFSDLLSSPPSGGSGSEPSPSISRLSAHSFAVPASDPRTYTTLRCPRRLQGCPQLLPLLIPPPGHRTPIAQTQCIGSINKQVVASLEPRLSPRRRHFDYRGRLAAESIHFAGNMAVPERAYLWAPPPCWASPYGDHLYGLKVGGNMAAPTERLLCRRHHLGM